MGEADRIERARQLYEDAVFGGDAGALGRADRELDGVEADLALARGRVAHARFLAERRGDPEELRLFERSAALYGALGDERGEGEALFWIGTFHQVVGGDNDRALPFFQRSRQLAEQSEDTLTLSYAVRHLGFVELASGRLESARGLLEQSIRLREEIGFVPGVAAGKLALAELVARSGDRAAAVRLLDEAAALAESSGARGIASWVEQARASSP